MGGSVYQIHTESSMLLGDRSRHRWGGGLGPSRVRRTITELSNARRRVSRGAEIEDVELYVESAARRTLFVLCCMAFLGLPYLFLRRSERALVKMTHRRARYGDDENLVVMVKLFGGNWKLANDSELVEPEEIRAFLKRIIATERDVLSETHDMFVEASRDDTRMYGLVFEVQYRRYILVEVGMYSSPTNENSLLFDHSQVELEEDHLWILSRVEGTFNPTVEELFEPGQKGEMKSHALFLKQNLGGMKRLTVADRLVLYGENVLTVKVPSRGTLFVDELLHPFFLFQIWAVVLWFLEEYFYYALCILFTSLYSAYVEASDVHANSQRLARLAKEEEMVTVIRDSQEEEISSRLLVPGDIMLLRGGMKMPCDGTLLCGGALANESSLTGESSPVRKTPWSPSTADMLNDGGETSEMSEMEDEDGERDEVLVAFEQEHQYGEEMEHERSEATTASFLSTPLAKVPAESVDATDSWSRSEHVVYSGTNILDARTPTYVVVIRTRADTVRGELVRDILIDNGSMAGAVGDLHRDSYAVLLSLALLGFALAIWSVGIFVNIYGVSTMNAVLQALDLITIALPPALPATVTFGLVFAIKRLQEHRILVTRANAVTSAAWLDLLCFDKTGTLTEDGLDVRGILPSSNGRFELGLVNQAVDIPGELNRLMACCHSLTRVNGEIVGDEVDLKLFELSMWGLDELGPADEAILQVSNIKEKSIVRVTRILDFKSELARMSVIARWDSGCSVYTKGAPEMIASRCIKSTVPSDLPDILNEFTEQGFRVLALAYRRLDNDEEMASSVQARSKIEKDLTFIGLAVLENRLKSDTSAVLRELSKRAKLRTVMITGDHPRTALSVARQCGIVEVVKNSPVLMCEMQRSGQQVTFMEVGTTGKKRLKRNEFLSRLTGGTQEKKKPCTVVLTGGAFRALAAEFKQIVQRGGSKSMSLLLELLKQCAVFARMSAADKTHLVRLFKEELGVLCGMCGDGANDAGALREATVGISLCGEDEGEVTASLAAPLTSRVTTIQAVAISVKEGRAAAASSLAALKYMFLYSILQLVSVVFLYTFGSVLSDGQFLFVDLFLIIPLGVLMGETAASLNLSEGKPSRRLWDKMVILSALGQSFVMVVFQVLVIGGLFYLGYVPTVNDIQTEILKTRDLVDRNEIVTSMFLFVNFQYIWSCLAFNLGPPFRRGYLSNRGFTLAVMFAVTVCTILVVGPPQRVKDFMAMTSLPAVWKLTILVLATLNLFVSYGLEMYINKLDAEQQR